MKNLVSALVISALVAVTLSHAASEQVTNLHQQHHQVALSERQGRSIDGNSGKSNTIEHHGYKKDLEKEKRAVQEFLTGKNIFKSIMKLLFGHPDEIQQTSRTVLSVFGKVLDLLKSTFGQKSRSGAYARTIRDSAEEAANAGITMLQGYVKSITTDNKSCILKNLCQASNIATRESRDLGYIIASVGGYASSYLIDTQIGGKEGPGFKAMWDASAKGRQGTSDDCIKAFSECTEDKTST